MQGGWCWASGRWGGTQGLQPAAGEAAGLGLPGGRECDRAGGAGVGRSEGGRLKEAGTQGREVNSGEPLTVSEPESDVMRVSIPHARTHACTHMCTYTCIHTCARTHGMGGAGEGPGAAAGRLQRGREGTQDHARQGPRGSVITSPPPSCWSLRAEAGGEGRVCLSHWLGGRGVGAARRLQPNGRLPSPASAL